MTTTDIAVDITDEQVAFFATNGWLAVERITTDEEVAWIGEIFDQLFEPDRPVHFDVMRPAGSEGPDLFPQTLFPELHHPELRDTTYVRNARRIAARLLGEDEADLTNWGHMLDKPPRRGYAAPWHQDEAYWDAGQRYHAVGAWMPLDDADLDNGCMWFLPGSHRDGLRPHRHLHGDESIHGLELVDELSEAEEQTAVAVPLEAGGASFHHPRTLHRSLPNTSDRPRRAYANEYQTPPVRRDEA